MSKLDSSVDWKWNAVNIVLFKYIWVRISGIWRAFLVREGPIFTKVLLKLSAMYWGSFNCLPSRIMAFIPFLWCLVLHISFYLISNRPGLLHINFRFLKSRILILDFLFPNHLWGAGYTCSIFIWAGGAGEKNDQHYNDIIMTAMPPQITSVSIVCATVCSGGDQRKYQNSASLAFVRGIHRWLVNSLPKGPVTWKMFPFDDTIMSIMHFLNMIYICIWLIARSLLWSIYCFNVYIFWIWEI